VPASGAWTRCMADSDCVDQRVCTYGYQQALGVAGPGACVKNCTGTTAVCDPPPPGATTACALNTLCGIPCGVGSTCPAGFACSISYSFCFPTP
jgi:hypothetical protein